MNFLSTRTVITVLLAALLLSGIAADNACAGDKEGKKPPMKRAQLIYEKIEGYPSCHGATVTELPGGDLLAAWYAGAYEKAKDVAIFGARFKKGGGGWSEPFILHDEPDISEGNPVLYTDSNGRVWFFYVIMYGDMWTDCKVFYRTSDDAGETWSETVTLRDDKGWMTRNKPVEMDGRMIVPMYDEEGWRAAFMITDDGGQSWKMTGTDVEVPGGVIQPSLIIRDDNSLLSFLRTGEPGGNVWTIESSDNGDTWGNPLKTELPNPNAAVDAVKLQSGAVVLIFNDSPYDRTPLSAAISYDDGKTWANTKPLEKKFGEFSYPFVIQDSSGVVHVLYTYKRTHIKHVAFKEEWLAPEE